MDTAALRAEQRRAAAPDTEPLEDGWGGEELESRLDEVWGGAELAQGDSRFFSRQARRIVDAGQSAFQRLYRAFVGARAALGLALGLALAAAGLLGVRPALPVSLICIAYAAQALSLWLLPSFRRPGSALTRLRSPQWLATIGVDIVAFTGLHLLASAPGGLNYAALLVLPVLMAGVLTPRLMALATAAGVTLAVLAVAWLAVLAGGEATVLMTQAGLAGAGFFLITLLAGELAGRLAREELTARGSLALARQQAQLNRLVIEEMQDGVLVVDRRGRVRAANPAARALLSAEGPGRPAPFPLRGHEAWRGLVSCVDRAFAEADWPAAGRDATLVFEPGLTRTLRVRVRFTRRRAPESEELCVLFLEDVRNMQARTRQEKLAAMGRVSAGIAHEIRNPLAAIAQANALLSEEAQGEGQRRLTQMVSDNVERLKRIVDDVMEVAPGAGPEPVLIDAWAQVSAICAEWARAAHFPTGALSPLRLDLPGLPLVVLFDPEHLRRVLINLLDNARRHAGESPGAIVLRLLARNDTQAVLSVASAGEPIPPDVERFLFEPFFSTRSRGAGLGLYICRELCERYGASIDYRLRPAGDPHRNEFFIVMRRQAPPSAEARPTPPP